MIGRGRMGYLLAAAASLLATIPPGSNAEVIPRRPEDYPDPERPRRARPPTDRESRRKRKELAKMLRQLKAGGISGAGLWRKCRAGGRVRGW